MPVSRRLFCAGCSVVRESGPPPGKAVGLRKPWKGILPASLSGGAECSVFCITCPASCKRGSSRCVPQLFGIEYHPASLEAGSESPFALSGTAGGLVSRKLTSKKRPCAGQAGTGAFWPGFSFTSRPARSPQGGTKGPAFPPPCGTAACGPEIFQNNPSRRSSPYPASG